MHLDELYAKALNFDMLTIEEGMHLFEQAPLTELMFVANELRKKQVIGAGTALTHRQHRLRLPASARHAWLWLMV